MPSITLPNNYDPRPYQLPLWNAIYHGQVRRAAAVWHRRAGKDLMCTHLASVMSQTRVGLYWHILPTYEQGRKAIWNGATKDGKRFLDAFPDDLVKRTRDDMMMKEMKNGSIYQVVGAEDPDRLVGTNPIGLIFSEYSIQNPRAWDYLRPILLENGGWAVFIYTPRGHNHGYKLYQNARQADNWFAQCLTIDDTGVLTDADLEEERTNGMTEELIRQEYYCLDPSTLVLTADLRWVPIGSLRAGDHLVGVDEHNSIRTNRKLRKSEVYEVRATEKPCRRITFEDGTAITASYEHPWLVKRAPVKRKHGTYTWIETCDLVSGMTIADSGFKPWQPDRTRDGGYLAGLYDGEGCISRATVQVAQRPGIVLDEIKRLLGERGFSYWLTSAKGCVTVSLALHDAVNLIGSLRPPRLLEKSGSLWDGRFPFQGVCARKIITVEDVGVKPVVGISTSTRTFIAEGLVTHNCSFEAPMSGAYYAEQMNRAAREGRITRVPWEERLPVTTMWDLGINDATAIWFVQVLGKEIRCIDYEEASDRSMQDWIKLVKDKPYVYDRHLGPHDIDVREYTSGKSRLHRAQELGVSFDVVPKHAVADGIQEVRRILGHCWFDEVNCEQGIEALKAYRREFDDKHQTYRDKPVHDWASHASDAFRVGAMGLSEPPKGKRDLPEKAMGDYDPFMFSQEMSSGGFATANGGWLHGRRG